MSSRGQDTAAAVVPEGDKTSSHYTGEIQRVTLDLAGRLLQGDEAEVPHIIAQQRALR